MLRLAQDDPETAAKWVALMEAFGPANVRDAVQATGAAAPYSTVTGIGDPGVGKGFAQAWLREHAEAEARRNSIILWASLIAAVAGVIAAVTGIMQVWPVF